MSSKIKAVDRGGPLEIGEHETVRFEDRVSPQRYSTSSKVTIRWSKVQYQPLDQDSWIDTHVISSSGRHFALVMGLYMDSNLFGHGYRYWANYRTIQLRTNEVQNNYTNGRVDHDLKWGSWFWMSKSWDAAGNAVSGTRGMFIFDPYFIIDTSVDFGDGYYQGQGTSMFAVADPYYFYIEPLPED